MRSYFLALALAMFVCQIRPAIALDRVDFVIDLDHIIIDRFKTEMGEVPKERLIEAPGGPYRLADGAEEFIQSLSEIPGAKITFFSHASPERNREVLAKILTSKGKTALDVAEGRVLSNADVTDTSKLPYEQRELLQPEERAFSATYKKDLRKVPGLNLDRAIIIDDQAGYALRGQEKNLLWVMDSGEMYGRPESAAKLVGVFVGEKDAEGLQEFAEAYVGDKNRLAYARGAIDEAMAISARDRTSLPEALWKLQWAKEGDRLHLNPNRNNVSLYRKGAQLFKSANPNYHFSPLLGPSASTDKGCLIRILRQLQTIRSEAK